MTLLSLIVIFIEKIKYFGIERKTSINGKVEKNMVIIYIALKQVFMGSEQSAINLGNTIGKFIYWPCKVCG